MILQLPTPKWNSGDGIKASDLNNFENYNYILGHNTIDIHGLVLIPNATGSAWTEVASGLIYIPNNSKLYVLRLHVAAINSNLGNTAFTENQALIRVWDTESRSFLTPLDDYQFGLWTPGWFLSTNGAPLIYENTTGASKKARVIIMARTAVTNIQVEASSRFFVLPNA